MVIVLEQPGIRKTRCRGCDALLGYNRQDMQTPPKATEEEARYYAIIVCPNCGHHTEVDRYKGA